MKQLSHLLSASSAKQIFFWSCILTHVLCVYNWVVDSRFLTWALNFQASNCYLGEYYCDIGQWILVNGGVSFLFSLYLFSILVAGIYGLFSMSRWANGFLIFSFLLKCFFISQSYFLIGNYHHIVFFLHLAYFFAKNKVLGVWWILFCSYFFAGLLKLNFNWITGQDFIVDPWFAGPFLIPLCVAAVIMECFLIFFIWSKDKKKRIVLYVTPVSYTHLTLPTNDRV